MEDVGQAFVLHYEDHEPPMWDKGLVIEEVVKHMSYGPTNRGGYTSMDLVDRCMTNIYTHWGDSILVSVQPYEK